MKPLALWYAIIDNNVILELQNEVRHEVLHNRYCLIKWAAMHEVQDDGYISDEDIEVYPETFMPRPHIMLIGLQELVLLKQPDIPQVTSLQY